MKNLIYILNILMILIFASCKDENSFMSVDDEPCYSILVSAPSTDGTRATYKEDGEDIAVVWEKGDVIYVGDNLFVYKKDTTNNRALFVLYGSMHGDDMTVRFGENENGNQIQKKNNRCREVLVGDATGYDFGLAAYKPGKKTITLMPERDKCLLHIQAKSPGMFLGKSLLKITGLDTEDLTIQLGDNSEYVFADRGDMLDIYVILPSGKTISGNLKFYFYAYDESKPNSIGDEYRYYMKCNVAMTTKSDEVIKLPLPAKAKSLIHITGRSPIDLLKGSMLVVRGWDQVVNVPLESEIAKDGEIDYFVTFPTDTKINNPTTLKVYLYSYDEIMKDWKKGDEYHYYNEYAGAKSSEVMNFLMGEQPDHIALQLGLPSGTKWSPLNIGATDRAETGTYYAWGETEPAKGGNYSEANCKAFRKNWAALNRDGFTTKGDKTGILVPEYDAATQNWGDDWKMPTRADFEELMNQTYCSYEMVKPGDYYGFEFTSKINNKKIFFANGGQWEGTVDKTTVEAWQNYSGKHVSDYGRGQYWVSNVALNNDEQRGSAFTSVKSAGGKFSDEPNFQDQNRSYGRLVRPVRKPN